MKTKFTKSLYVAAIISASTLGVFAQKANVGIGTTQPDESAVLDINSSNKGLLIPRMSLQQRNSIQNPANGLMVYQTDLLSGFYFYDGKEWKPLTTETNANSVASDPNDWSFGGNAPAAGSFVGTTNSVPLVFKTNNVKSGEISNGTNMSLGYEALLNGGTGINNMAIGKGAMKTATDIAGTSYKGSYNVAVGLNSMTANTTGYQNVGMGWSSLAANTTGNDNLALGYSTLRYNISGLRNTAVGTSSLLNTAANDNVGIGYAAGLSNTTGVNNIYIGSFAGYFKQGSGNIYIGKDAGRAAAATTESNKLYIANSSATPLIKGEFDNKNLKINTGATVSQTLGFLAVGNFDAAFAMPAPTNSYRLIVQDGIITEKIKVAVKGTADWADYVFEPSYNLMPLDKVESFVKENKHLPNVPSAEDMSKNGLDVTQTSAKLMEKIEELTLYMIEMNKEIKALKSENIELKKMLK